VTDPPLKPPGRAGAVAALAALACVACCAAPIALAVSAVTAGVAFYFYPVAGVLVVSLAAGVVIARRRRESRGLCAAPAGPADLPMPVVGPLDDRQPSHKAAERHATSGLT
jgi:hypothetical protein